MHECTELSSSTNPLFHANSPFTLYSFFWRICAKDRSRKGPSARIPHHRSAPGNETIFGLQIAASFGKIQPKQSGFARDRADSVRIMRIEQRQKKNDALLAERIIQMAEIKPLMYGKGGADEKCIVTAYETGNLMCEVCRAVSSPDDWAINSLN